MCEALLEDERNRWRAYISLSISYHQWEKAFGRTLDRTKRIPHSFPSNWSVFRDPPLFHFELPEAQSCSQSSSRQNVNPQGNQATKGESSMTNQAEINPSLRNQCVCHSLTLRRIRDDTKETRSNRADESPAGLDCSLTTRQAVSPANLQAVVSPLIVNFVRQASEPNLQDFHYLVKVYYSPGFSRKCSGGVSSTGGSWTVVQENCSGCKTISHLGHLEVVANLLHFLYRGIRC